MDLDDFLRQQDLHPVRHEHRAVMTVEESEQWVPPLPGAKTKNLFLRDKKGERHFLVSAAHDATVDLKTLGTAMGAGRLGFASAERLQRNLGIAPGAVSVLALCNDTRGTVELVIDAVLWNAPAIQAHPMVNTATMILTHAELERFLQATGHVPRVIEMGSPAAIGSSGLPLMPEPL